MTQTVNVPGVGKLNFPDEMSQPEMAAAIRRNFPQVGQPTQRGTGRPGGDQHQQIEVPELTGAEVGAEGKSWYQDLGNGAQWKQAIGNVGKLGATAVTGTAANALGLASKYGRGWGWLLADPEGAEKTKQDIQNALTYQPKNESAQDLQETIGHYPAKVMGTIEKYGGTGARDFTEAALLAEGVRAPIKRFEAPKVIPRPKPIPTTAELKAAAHEAYGNAKESGVIVPAKSYESALADITKMATEEGLDPTLHPKSSAVMKRLTESAGKDLSLTEAETLRKIALDAEDDVNSIGKPTADARLAGKIVDDLDEKIEALSTNDEARALWSRSSRSQLLDTMIHRAEIRAGAHYTQAGMEHALRQEFKTLALNPRRMRGLTAAQRAAVEKVAKGGPLENTLRGIGKMDPTTGPVAAISGVATGLASGGLIPLAGFVSKRLATKATKGNVDLAREALVGRGAPVVTPPKIVSPAMREANRMSGDLSLGGDYATPSFLTSGAVMPSRAAASRGLELQPDPIANPQQLPARPPMMTADTPPALGGGMPFRPSNMAQSPLEFAQPQSRYPGSIEYTPPSMAPQMAGDLQLDGVLGNKSPTPRIPSAKDIRGELRILEGRIRQLTQEQLADPSYVKSLSEEWKRLQAELALRESRKASS